MSSSGGLVAPNVGTASSLSNSSVLPTSHHFLSGAFFSLRICMQGSRSLSGLPIINCRYFRVHGYHFLGTLQFLPSA
jgi:hypothetical protein